MIKHIGYWLMVVAAVVIFLCAPVFAQDEPIPAKLTLDDAVRQALKNSSLIRQAADAVAAQEDAEIIARAGLLPSVSANYNYTRLKDAPYILFNHQPFEMNGVNQVHWDVSLRQPLFTGFGLISRNLQPPRM